MKHTRNALRLAVPAAFTAAFFLGVCPGAFAQKRPKSVDTSSNVQVAKRTVKRTPTTKPVNVARTGLIMIGPILEHAQVFLNDKPAKDVTVDAKNNRLLVDDVPPGPQKVTYDAPDYVIVEKTIPVRAGNEYLWIVTPKPALATLVVKTLPDTAVFVDNEPKGRTPASGSLTLNDVRLGLHEIKLVKDAYVEFKKSATFEFDRPVTLDARLEPMPSSAEFSDLFDINLKRWTVPASGWTLKGGRLQLANASALGYPTGVNYRDIEAMAFHLKLENGGGAAWALRAKDPNNYYLFYLSGPKGLFPGYFNTYVVKDGRFDPQDPVSSSPVVETLKAGGEYQITIRAVGNVIEHEITPASTGQPIKLGVFEDPNNTFGYGGIGFRTVGTETFSVDELFVQPK